MTSVIGENFQASKSLHDCVLQSKACFPIRGMSFCCFPAQGVVLCSSIMGTVTRIEIHHPLISETKIVTN